MVKTICPDVEFCGCASGFQVVLLWPVQKEFKQVWAFLIVLGLASGKALFRRWTGERVCLQKGKETQDICLGDRRGACPHLFSEAGKDGRGSRDRVERPMDSLADRNSAPVKGLVS
jgi:hypothetical protein